MISFRVIPVLTLMNQGLVKTTRFKNPRYVGDPLNAVKIFNEKEVDEIVLLDISASAEGRSPNLKLINEIASECFIPLAYGGGISTFQHAKSVFDQGVEKIIINSNLLDLKLINSIVEVYGSSSLCASVDIKKNFFGNYNFVNKSNQTKSKYGIFDLLKVVQENGVGEIFIQSINNDGVMKGYDLDIIEKIKDIVKVPLVICGGAGSINDFSNAITAGASAVAASSFFIFKGIHKAVLISYPNQNELKEIYE